MTTDYDASKSVVTPSRDGQGRKWKSYSIYGPPPQCRSPLYPFPVAVISNTTNVATNLPEYDSPTRKKDSLIPQLGCLEARKRPGDASIIPSCEVRRAKALSDEGVSAQYRPPQWGSSYWLPAPGPSNHVIVPQSLCIDATKVPDSERVNGPRYKSITFQNYYTESLGVLVAEFIEGKTSPLVDEEANVFSALQEEEIGLHIQWPGYVQLPYKKHLRIRRDAFTITRKALLLSITKALIDFRALVVAKSAKADPGHERWSFGDTPEGHGIDASAIYVTKIKHMGGKNWQPEFFVPV